MGLSSTALRQGLGTPAGCEVARLSPKLLPCQCSRHCPIQPGCATVPPHMGEVLDLAERFWRGEIPRLDLWRPTGAREELASGTFFFHTWANVTLIRTEAGLAPRRHRQFRGAREDLC